MSKLPETQNEKIYSNYEGKKFKSQIKDDIGVKKLIRKHLYKKQIQTPVQENLSNALDAMVLSNKIDQPIKVYLPDLADETLRIRDFGPGLSDEQVENIYANFGVSTKREDNNSIGCWGYGSKSFFAYTNEFFVISYYNGVETTFLAKIEEDDDTSFEIKHKQETDQPNGLEVVCPVKTEDITKFCESVVRACFFWKVQPIIIGDKWKEKVDHLLNEVNSPLFSTSQGNIFKLSDELNRILGVRKGVIVNSAGIPFNMIDSVHSDSEIAQLSKNNENLTLVINFSNGDLDIPPDRESLNENKHNIPLLKNAYKTSLTEFETYYYEKVEHYADLDALQEACTNYKNNVIDTNRDFNDRKIEYNQNQYIINKNFNLLWDCSELGLNIEVNITKKVKMGHDRYREVKTTELKNVKHLPYNAKIPAIAYINGMWSERRIKNTITKMQNNMRSFEECLFPITSDMKISDVLITHSSESLSLNKEFDHIKIEHLINTDGLKWPKSAAKKKTLAKLCKVSDEKSHFWFDTPTIDIEELEGQIVEFFVGSYLSHIKNKMNYIDKGAISEMRQLHKERTGSSLNVFFVSSGVYKKLQKQKIKTRTIKEVMAEYVSQDDIDFYTQPRTEMKVPSSLKKIIALPGVEDLKIKELENIKKLCVKEENLIRLKQEYETRKLPKYMLSYLNIQKSEAINLSSEAEQIEKQIKEKYPLFMNILDNYVYSNVVEKDELAMKQFMNSWKLAIKGKI